MYLLYINTLCQRSWLSVTPENGHLQLGMAIGSILLISGSFNRRVLYYNVYILYYTLLYQNQFIYFTILLYNTIQCTVRIQNTLFIPGCSCCSCLLLSIWLTTVHIEFWVVSRKKNNKDCHFGQSLCTTVCRFGGDCKEFNFTFTFKKFNQQMGDQVMAFYLGG